MSDPDRIQRLLDDPREPIRPEALRDPPDRIQAHMHAPKRHTLYWVLLVLFIIVVCATLAALIARFA